MPSALSSIVAKDGTPATIAGGILAVDKSGGGTGPFFAAQTLVDTQGVNTATIKAASTAPATTDTTIVVGAADGNVVTMGITTGAAVTTDVAGTLQQYLRGLVKLFTTATFKAASTAAAATDPALVVALSPNNTALGAGATTAATIRTALASDSPGIIATGTPQASSSAILSTQGPGTTASRINAAASTNATNLKASAGRMFGLSVFNAAAYNVFLKFYDKASAPTVGTDTPVWTIPVQAGGGFAEEFIGAPFPFTTGISYAITKLQADSDTTVVVAGDLTGSVRWA